MKRRERIEKKGYQIVRDMNGRYVEARKNNGLTKIGAESITELHRKIFGY